MDYEARVETFGEALGFFKRQEKVLAQADSDSEYSSLLLETESVPLGEIANWFSRRSNIGVT